MRVASTAAVRKPLTRATPCGSLQTLKVQVQAAREAAQSRLAGRAAGDGESAAAALPTWQSTSGQADAVRQAREAARDDLRRQQAALDAQAARAKAAAKEARKAGKAGADDDV